MNSEGNRKRWCTMAVAAAAATDAADVDVAETNSIALGYERSKH